MERANLGQGVQRTFMRLVATVSVVFLFSLLFMISQGRKGLSEVRTVLAVLPFESELVEDSKDRYAGFAEGLAAYFGRADPQILGVLGPASTERYTNRGLGPVAIGNELLADLVVTGREFGTRDSLSLVVDLLTVADGSNLWSREFRLDENTDFRDLLSQVSTEVTSVLDLPR